MDISIVLSPFQPDGLLIKNAADQGHALRVALDYCWKNYPGFFVLDTNDPFTFPYRGKVLMEGYPTYEVIEWN